MKDNSKIYAHLHIYIYIHMLFDKWDKQQEKQLFRLNIFTYIYFST